ncbi:amidohydrolase family protein, partial [Pseudomonas carnis]
MPLTRKAYRAAILHSIADPAIVGVEASYEYFEDGLLVIDNGQISALGHASDLLPSLPADIDITHYQDALITPGLIDTHIHLPQTGMVGAYGEQLLDWLNTYTFPCESQFADKAHAE